MLNFIDISSWQGDIDLSPMPIDAVIVKATEGIDYVNPWCDTKVQQAISLGMEFGFYHYAKACDPIAEADFFVDACLGYFNLGIPVLDWEEEQDVEWVNAFVHHVYDRTGVIPWIYGNPWRFNQGGVWDACGRWVASYPDVIAPGIDYDPGEPPATDGLVCAWQYASDGKVPGYEGNLDINKFYGDKLAWHRYASPGNIDNAGDASDTAPDDSCINVFENDTYRITVERK